MSDRYFLVADEEGERVVAQYKAGLPPFGFIGGVSGAPVFVVTEGVASLSGVVKEVGDGHDATIFVAHASFVGSDGLISRQ